jgi:hypothetical protein
MDTYKAKWYDHTKETQINEDNTIMRAKTLESISKAARVTIATPDRKEVISIEEGIINIVGRPQPMQITKMTSRDGQISYFITHNLKGLITKTAKLYLCYNERADTFYLIITNRKMCYYIAPFKIYDDKEFIKNTA